MKLKKLINPERKKCICGKNVLNHHWLCDSCWGEKEKKRKHKEQRKLLIPLLKKLDKQKKGGKK